jgi:hypothetical protein
MGKDPTPIRPLYPPDQAAAFFRSSENDPGLISTGAVDQVLIHLSSQLAATLAARGRAARTIRLEVTTRKGKQYGARQLRQAASRRDTILAAARRLWEAALATEPVLGIGLYSENLETPPVQQGKILNHDSLVIDGLNRAMHSVHSRFGATALQTAGQLPLTRRELIRTMWEKENL